MWVNSRENHSFYAHTINTEHVPSEGEKPERWKSPRGQLRKGSWGKRNQSERTAELGVRLQRGKPEGLRNKEGTQKTFKERQEVGQGHRLGALPKEVKVRNFPDLEAEADFPAFRCSEA